MMNERGLRILAALDQLSPQLNATPAQISLAWLLARGVTAPIASATSAAQLNELIGFLDVKLDAAAMKLLNEASDGGSVDEPKAPPPRRS